MKSNGVGFGGVPSPLIASPQRGAGALDVDALDIAVPPHVVDVPPDVGDVLAMVDDVMAAMTRLEHDIEQRWREAITSESHRGSEFLAAAGHTVHRALLILGQASVIG